jgi:hypothetical protein
MILCVGDLIVGGSEPDSLFRSVSSILRSADLSIGHLEVPFTARSIEKYHVEIPTEIFATEHAIEKI